MNVFAYQAAWASAALGVSPSELVVALALADHADKAGLAWPGRRRLAEMTGASEATVKRALAKLRSMGVVEVVSGGKGRGSLTVYRLKAAPEKGARVIPFRAMKGGVSDPLSRSEKGSSAPIKGVTGCTQNPYGNHKTRARPKEGDPKEVWCAFRLAEASAKGSPLTLPAWMDRYVAGLAITMFGACPDDLRKRGCDVPPDLRRAAE